VARMLAMACRSSFGMPKTIDFDVASAMTWIPCSPDTQEPADAIPSAFLADLFPTRPIDLRCHRTDAHAKADLPQ
jgi:hypothetical protein